MPEGPEVKISADLIRPLLVEHIVYDALPIPAGRYGGGNLPEGYKEFYDSIAGRDVTITDVQVKGKFMYWSFSNGWYLFNTFGMTGQWSPTQGKHPCFLLVLNATEPHENMYFNDHRHFGTVKFINNKRELDKKLEELGWDPLDGALDKHLKWLTFQLSKTSKSIAEVLMDQSLFSGVGNYIRAEALYACKLSPWREANKLSQDEIKTLCQAIVDVMQESYQHQGATISTYKTAYGAEGKYATLFKVYGQKQDAAGHKIIKQQTPDKRTIHWCPEVQI